MLREFLNRFGAIASWMGMVEQDAVQTALDNQAREGGRIGEHLQRSGHLSHDQVTSVLEFQQLTRHHPDSPLLTFTVRFNAPLNSIPFLTLQGVLDGSALCGRRLVAALRVQPPGPLIISMAEVFYINRQGTTVLMNAWARHPFALVGVPDLARPLLDQLGVESLVPIFDQPQDALSFDFSSFESEELPPTPGTRALHRGQEDEPPPPLTIEVEEIGGITWIHVGGVLDPLSTGRGHRRLLAALTERPENRFAIDLSRVTHCAPDALVFLGEAPEGSEVSLIVPEFIAQDLTQLGLHECYPIFLDRDEAVRALAAEFIALESSPVYHRRHCRALRNSRIPRRRYLTLADLKGRRPCKLCAT
ncbi:MAG: STAS domain-containing protein [Planctomycetota bacterium]